MGGGQMLFSLTAAGASKIHQMLGQPMGFDELFATLNACMKPEKI